MDQQSRKKEIKELERLRKAVMKVVGMVAKDIDFSTLFAPCTRQRETQAEENTTESESRQPPCTPAWFAEGLQLPSVQVFSYVGSIQEKHTTAELLPGGKFLQLLAAAAVQQEEMSSSDHFSSSSSATSWRGDWFPVEYLVVLNGGLLYEIEQNIPEESRLSGEDVLADTLLPPQTVDSPSSISPSPNRRRIRILTSDKTGLIVAVVEEQRKSKKDNGDDREKNSIVRQAAECEGATQLTGKQIDLLKGEKTLSCFLVPANILLRSGGNMKEGEEERKEVDQQQLLHTFPVTSKPFYVIPIQESPAARCVLKKLCGEDVFQMLDPLFPQELPLPSVSHVGSSLQNYLAGRRGETRKVSSALTEELAASPLEKGAHKATYASCVSPMATGEIMPCWALDGASREGIGGSCDDCGGDRETRSRANESSSAVPSSSSSPSPCRRGSGWKILPFAPDRVQGLYLVEDFVSEEEEELMVTHFQAFRSTKVKENDDDDDDDDDDDTMKKGRKQQQASSLPLVNWQTLANRRVAHFNRRFQYENNQVGPIDGPGTSQPTPQYYHDLVARINGVMKELLLGKEEEEEKYRVVDQTATTTAAVGSSSSSSYDDNFLVADQCTVNEYCPGPRGNIRSGIAPHVDNPVHLDDFIFSVSLLSHTVMDFKPLGVQSSGAGGGGPSLVWKSRTAKEGFEIDLKKAASEKMNMKSDPSHGCSAAVAGSAPPPTQSIMTGLDSKEQRGVEEGLELFLPPRSLLIMSGESRYSWTHGIAKRLSDRISQATPTIFGEKDDEEEKKLECCCNDDDTGSRSGGEVVELKRGLRYSLTFRRGIAS